MAKPNNIVFLFDVDNTLLDNDRVQRDLRDHLERNYSLRARDRYWAIFEELRDELGYADYLGALERYRVGQLHDPRVLRIANWLVEYPFAERVYPGAIEGVRHVRGLGTSVILSDGDAVFQPHKIVRSGLWQEFDEHVLIYIHKEQELGDVEHWYPADHYVMIDDKLRILDAIKKVLRDRVTTVFARQGHYANDPEEIAAHPPADMMIERVGDLLQHDRASFLRT
jgi:hypothetical protein